MERVLGAFLYALVAGLGAIVAGGRMPDTGVEWCGIALAALTAGWGKYTTSTTLVWPPDRVVWTEDERREAAGLPTKRP